MNKKGFFSGAHIVIKDYKTDIRPHSVSFVRSRWVKWLSKLCTQINLSAEFSVPVAISLAQCWEKITKICSVSR